MTLSEVELSCSPETALSTLRSEASPSRVDAWLSPPMLETGGKTRIRLLLFFETLGASVLNSGVILRLLGAWLAYRLLLALYNVSPFHPLYKFPGPRLAAATFIYEFLMHEIYGPIVRISPEELHCNDSSFVTEIYPGGGRVRDKHQHYLNSNVGSVAVTAFGARARGRTSCTGCGAARRPQPLLLQGADGQARAERAPAGAAAYAFGEPRGFLDHEGWGHNYKGALEGFTTYMYFWRFFPQLGGLGSLTPPFLEYIPETFAMLMREL
ncbi:hypothetical protein PG994_008602 [Apiospora phragmitis]|uniref:Uncharacterized protein n=1 Tax=Apiospora phragmitis TaxID=2905665 RepID=A0ABR1UGY3_9PEZI